MALVSNYCIGPILRTVRIDVILMGDYTVLSVIVYIQVTFSFCVVYYIELRLYWHHVVCVEWSWTW